ncbi:MAG: CHAP domain-containing protein [Bacilli bacterium]|nr:CHAP domain-containing protein [Bacilli bacterium]MBQ3511794.1 CHAP domain-containing protein [Bacilli bacterium]
MKDNTERDVKRSIDRLSTLSSEASNHTFQAIDRIAKQASDFAENKSIEEDLTKNDKEVESRLKTSENTQEIDNKQDATTQEENNSTSRLKTNVNEDNSTDKTDSNVSEKTEGVKSDKDTPKKSKLKTVVEKTNKKVFKFNDNQGKASKVATVVSKGGEKVSKAGRAIVRTSRELNKAMSEDGSGTEYINEKITRKIKTKASNKIKKKTKKVAGKLGKKFSQTIGKKLLKVAKVVVVKLIKMLISLLAALAEFIIPLALILIIIIAVCSIFGSTMSEDSLNSYQQYMNSIQEEYDKKVDEFLKDNPDGEVFAVDGNYGRIDWRIPLSIMQGIGAELEFDQTEKDLIQKFKSEGLLEKHEILEQIVEETDDEGNTVELTKKVLVITNSMYEDYMDWCKDNYSYIANFSKTKNISDGIETYFTDEQLEMITLLYNSEFFADLLGTDFKTRTPTYGKTDIPLKLNTEHFNSKNALTNAGFKGQCTWFSYGRALQVSGKKMPTGNAQTWINSAIAMGYETGTQPSYNSVVVLSSNRFGHVAFVEAYDGKTITVSEGNIGNACRNDDSCSQVEYANEHANELVRTKTYSSFDEYRRINKNNGYTIIGFIYLD